MIMKYFFLILFCVELIFSQGLDDNCFDRESSFGQSGSCEWDVNCATWAPSYLQNQQSRSVVKIYLPNCGECTGTLLAQKDVQTNDFKYYVLTAKHCINKAGPGLYTEEDFKNTRFIFDYWSIFR